MQAVVPTTTTAVPLSQIASAIGDIVDDVDRQRLQAVIGAASPSMALMTPTNAPALSDREAVLLRRSLASADAMAAPVTVAPVVVAPVVVAPVVVAPVVVAPLRTATEPDLLEEPAVALGDHYPTPVELLTAIRAGTVAVLATVADSALLAALQHPGFAVLSSKQPKSPEAATAIVRLFARAAELSFAPNADPVAVKSFASATHLDAGSSSPLLRSLCAQVGCLVEDSGLVGSFDVAASLMALGDILPAGDASLRALLRWSRSMNIDPSSLHVRGKNLGETVQSKVRAVIAYRQAAAPAPPPVTLAMLPSMAKPLAAVETTHFGSPWDTHIGNNAIMSALSSRDGGGAYTATDRQLLRSEYRRTDGRPPSTLVQRLPHSAELLHGRFADVDRDPRSLEFFARISELASPGSQPHEVLREALTLRPLPASAVTDETVLSLLRLAKAIGLEPDLILVDGGMSGVSTLASSPAFPWYLIDSPAP